MNRLKHPERFLQHFTWKVWMSNFFSGRGAHWIVSSHAMSLGYSQTFDFLWLEFCLKSMASSLQKFPSFKPTSGTIIDSKLGPSMTLDMWHVPTCLNDDVRPVRVHWVCKSSSSRNRPSNHFLISRISLATGGLCGVDQSQFNSWLIFATCPTEFTFPKSCLQHGLLSNLFPCLSTDGWIVSLDGPWWADL